MLPLSSMVPTQTITVRCQASALTVDQLDRLRAIAEGTRSFDVLALGLGGIHTDALITGWQFDGDAITLYAAIGRPKIGASGDPALPVGVRLPGLTQTFGFETHAAAHAWLQENTRGAGAPGPRRTHGHGH